MWVRFACLALPIAAFVAACLIESPKKFLWWDEFCTLVLVRDSNPFHMLHALGDQVDASPPLYYLVMWGWTKVFGASALALRLPSALCFGAALVLLYRIVLKYFGAMAAAMAPALCLCLCPTIKTQLVEARCFGLFFLLVVAAVGLLLQASRRKNPGPGLWIGMFLLNGCLVNVHIYGFAYSAALFGVSVCLWLATGRPSWRFSLSALCGWALFLPWVPSFLRQIDMTKPRVFLRKPKLHELWPVMSSELPIALIALLLAGIVLLTLYVRFLSRAPVRNGSGTTSFAAATRAARALLTLGLLATALIAVVPLAWAFSVIRQPIFVSRYMLPSLAGWVLLIAALLGLCLRLQRNIGAVPGNLVQTKNPAAILQAIPPLAVAGLVALVSATVVAGAVLAKPGREISWDDRIFPDKSLPVLFEEGTAFNQMRYYGRNPDRFYILLDWQAALNCQNVGSTLGYKILSGLRRNYDPGHIYDSREIPASFQKFYFFASAGEGWFTSYLADNPNYSLSQSAAAKEGAVYLVERRPISGSPSAGP